MHHSSCVCLRANETTNVRSSERKNAHLNRAPARGDRGESARGEGVLTNDLDCGERDFDLDIPDSRKCCRVKSILGKNYLNS